MSRPIAVLIGTMGAGKTTVGELLAARLGAGFLDTDQLIEQRQGKPVQEIFIDEGEVAFRALEREAVARSLELFDGVLSLGGGAVLDPATQALLAAHQVVFLRVGLSDAVRRVGVGESRPLLNSAIGGIRARIKQLLDERTPVYEGLARIIVNTDGRDPDDIAAELAGLIAPEPAPEPAPEEGR